MSRNKIREFSPYNPDGEGFPTGQTNNTLDSGVPLAFPDDLLTQVAGDYQLDTGCECSLSQASTSVDQAIPEPSSIIVPQGQSDFIDADLQSIEGWNGYVNIPQEGWDISGAGGTQQNNEDPSSPINLDLLPDELNHNEAIVPRKRNNKFIKGSDPIADTKDLPEMTLDLPELLSKSGAEYHYGDPEERPHMVIDGKEESDLVDDIDERKLEEAVAVRPMGRYEYHGHEGNADVCKKLDGSVWEMSDPRRPIVPSEGAGLVNTHPNCKCTWDYFTEIENDEDAAKKIKPPRSKRGRLLADENVKGLSIKHLRKVNKIINKKLSTGDLHQIDDKGRVLDKKFGETTKRIREAIVGVRSEAEWLTDEYLSKIKSVAPEGAWFIIRASAETITDHRSEGEPYPRLLEGDELHSMARTAVGHSMDINHLGIEYKTQSVIADSEYDKSRREIQMLVHEDDPEIIEAVKNGTINAVSINGGAPRHEEIVDCDHPAGKCIVPRGVILGELDGIALTYVVTSSSGLSWQGNQIDQASPGVKSTAIEML